MRVVESESQIAAQINKMIADVMRRAIYKAEQPIRLGLPKIVLAALRTSPEYNSLMNGKLWTNFGLTDPESKLEGILNIWGETVVVSTIPVTSNASSISGKISFSMIRRDFTDVINTTFGTQITEKGQKLEWLKWLLLLMDKIIIRDYTIGYLRKSSDPTYSRTDGTIMVERKGRFFKVPQEFAGNINNNWVTRAVENLDKEIDSLVEREIKRAIR